MPVTSSPFISSALLKAIATTTTFLRPCSSTHRLLPRRSKSNCYKLSQTQVPTLLPVLANTLEVSAVLRTLVCSTKGRGAIPLAEKEENPQVR